MSARRARTLSRLFQTTIRVSPEKKYFDGVEDAIPVLSREGLVFDPDLSSKEHETIWYYHTKLVFKDGKFLDMDLLDGKRRLLCASKLFRRSDSAFERGGQIELFVLLFDNYLVITKPVGKGPDATFYVDQRPIPLDLLRLETYEDTRNRARRRRSMILLGRDDAAGFRLPELGAPGTRRGTFPFTITHEGRFGDSYTLYADTEETRLMWKSKLDEAIQLRQQSSGVFKVRMLNRESFLMKIGAPSGYLPEGRQLTRTINCVTPFTTGDGRTLMAIGCVEGLWIGDIRDSQSFHRILPLRMIRQCAVLEEFGIFLILAHNDLCAYDLESCVPTLTGPKTFHPPQKLNRRGEVSFFRVGMIDGKVHVIFSRRKRENRTTPLIPQMLTRTAQTGTIFQISEVVRPTEHASAPISSDARPEWFRIHREFIILSDCTDVIFLRRGLVILYRNGLCMFDPLKLRCVDMPLPARHNVEHKNLIKRCASSRSLGIFRLQEEAFLLCYDEFGAYINKHGILINDRVAVEWEGVAERVSYHHPYVLLFSSKFVEVRHAASGQLEQVIRGNSMRCVWEGEGHRGEDPATVYPSQNLDIIGVANAPAGLDELAVQCVFTLVPSDRPLSPIQTQPPLSTTERAGTRL